MQSNQNSKLSNRNDQIRKETNQLPWHTILTDRTCNDFPITIADIFRVIHHNVIDIIEVRHERVRSKDIINHTIIRQKIQAMVVESNTNTETIKSFVILNIFL